MIEESNLPVNVYCKFVKQRTPEWMNIRSTAAVTESTVYKAIGLETLRAEQLHFDEVVRGKPKLLVPQDVEVRLQHGQTNEINGIATLVAVILPT
ncbi:hypothetical protein FSP39_024656 [Pinctada imbricata]|uniref:Uncharacterized protein n=1 Tax=Pinctada imbricata TaxID=66713 RepID=A0AA89BL94_PINIB|nr:hypothetical protein FSP39_024656 [Pinctada imbricata]